MRCCSNHGTGPDGRKHGRGLPLFWIAVIGLAGILIYLKWNSLAGFLPYLLLLACPLMHVFMHRSHHGKSSDADQSKPPSAKPDSADK